MNIPSYREHSHDKKSQNEIAKDMNTVLSWLYNSVAPESVQCAAKEVCEQLAAEKEIAADGD